MNKLITFLLALILSPLTLSAQGKRYHGDGIDNVLEYVPLVATFTLKGCGVESASYWLGDKLMGERSRWHLGTDGQTLSLRIDL